MRPRQSALPPAAESVATGLIGRRTESRRRSSARWPPKTRLSSLSRCGDGGPGNTGWALYRARTPSAPTRILDASSARWCHPGAVKGQAPTVAGIQTVSASQGQAAPATRRQLGSRPRPGGACFRGRRCGTGWRSGESPGGDAYEVAFRYLVAGLRRPESCLLGQCPNSPPQIPDFGEQLLLPGTPWGFTCPERFESDGLNTARGAQWHGGFGYNRSVTPSPLKPNPLRQRHRVLLLLPPPFLNVFITFVLVCVTVARLCFHF